MELFFHQKLGFQKGESKMKIIAVVPAYNCEKFIKKVIEDLNNHFVDKILIIDDGSKDKTAEIARETGTEVISYRDNKGLGYALRTGFKEALKRKFDLILTFDGDGQHLASDIKKVKIKFDQNPTADIVIGTRIRDRKHWSKFPFHRLWGNLILTILTNFACGRRFTTDSQSGYRAIKREALKKMQLTSNRMAISSEIIIESCKRKLKLIEVSIIPTYGEEISNQRLIIDSWNIFKMVVCRVFQKRGR
ncbi:glycosyltransferase family 2 protein [Patescibacteria group bacterium]